MRYGKSWIKLSVILTISFGCGLYLCVFLYYSVLEYSSLFGHLERIFLLWFSLMVVINLIAMITLLFKGNYYGFIPLCISITFICFYGAIMDYGKKERITRFHKRLPEYQEVIQHIENRRITEKHTEVDLSPKYKHLANIVFAYHDDPNETLTVEFLYSNRAIGHVCFLYRSDDNPSNWQYIDQWSSCQKIVNKWYHVYRYPED
jgi:hypothetical protein